MRSLRWEVNPQDELDDTESTTEWLDFFNGVGIKLQQLVLKRKRKKMALLEKKISDLQGKLDPIKGTQQLINFDNEIKRKLEKIDRETQKKKLKKFRRDTNDFKRNSIYLWQNADNTSTFHQPLISAPTLTNHQHKPETSSAGLADTPIQTTQLNKDRRPPQTPQPNRDGRPLQTPHNIRGRGNKQPGRGRNHGQRGSKHISDNTRQEYNINTQNRYKMLSHLNQRDNEYHIQSSRQTPFLGRGMRGHPRGCSRGNRPWRNRSRQHIITTIHRNGGTPPEWEQQHSPVRGMRNNYEEVAEQDGESSIKR